MNGFNRTAGLAISAFMLAAPVANAGSILKENPGAVPVMSEGYEDDSIRSIQKFECIEDQNGIKLARFEHTDEDKEHFGWTDEDHPPSYYTIEMVRYLKDKLIENSEDKNSAWYKEKLEQYDAAIEALEGHTKQCEISTFYPEKPSGPPVIKSPG